MIIQEIKETEKIVLQISGRVDSVTSPDLQTAILLALQKMKNLELDFKMVEYISSAGLRSLLMGHKTALSKEGNMVVKNVPDIVTEVFHVTGFNTVLNVK